ncbi:MAG: hypothetical protein ACJ761_10790 [Chloroflexota bacterium]
MGQPYGPNTGAVQELIARAREIDGRAAETLHQGLRGWVLGGPEFHTALSDVVRAAHRSGRHEAMLSAERDGQGAVVDAVRYAGPVRRVTGITVETIVVGDLISQASWEYLTGPWSHVLEDAGEGPVARPESARPATG